MRKVSRSQFCGYKHAVQPHVIKGPIDKPPIPASRLKQLPVRMFVLFTPCLYSVTAMILF
jgi:hypothetical protein